MAELNNDIDITKNIRLIETLKSQLLTDIAQLYSNLAENNSQKRKLSDIISDFMITAYLLSEKLGVGYNAVEINMINKLKLIVINEDDILYDDALKLLKYLHRKTNL